MRQRRTLAAPCSTAAGQTGQARQGTTRVAHGEYTRCGTARAWPRLQREPRLLLRHVVHHDCVLDEHAAADRERRAGALRRDGDASAARGMPCDACARLRGARERHRSEHLDTCTAASSRTMRSGARRCTLPPKKTDTWQKKPVQPLSVRRSPCAAPQGNQRQLRGALACAAVEMPVAAAFCGAPGSPCCSLLARRRVRLRALRMLTRACCVVVRRLCRAAPAGEPRRRWGPRDAAGGTASRHPAHPSSGYAVQAAYVAHRGALQGGNH